MTMVTRGIAQAGVGARPPAAERQRLRVDVEGIVQGVGFRPFVYRLATEEGLAGFVLNHSAGVVIEVEGQPAVLERFLHRLSQEVPPLARLEKVRWQEVLVRHEKAFRIERSAAAAEHFTFISPDVATCADCLAELYDPADRRYRYPFTNCTNCGPRFTIIRDVPYDRPQTTMDVFPMCPECQREYEDPLDRRFHAQPNACPVCGPKVELRDRAGQLLETPDPFAAAAALLRAGFLLAVKGLGGYHLACDARNETAVATLRSRKYREDKPFALIACDPEQIRLHCLVTREDERLLTSPRRPIVLLRRRPTSPIAPSVAPGQRTFGFLLPYTPFHHLLLQAFGGELVLTSGNVSDEPIAYQDEDAWRRLRPIADYFLVHNREIHIRCDDSVTRTFRGREMILRRSRGYAPQPLRLPWGEGPSVLAVGGHYKNTFCLTRHGYAFLGHHIGDLENEAALRSFEEGIDHFQRLFDITPEIIAHDLHPDYLATKYAQRRLDGRRTTDETPVPRRLVGVQHHHAHIASCLVDNGCPERVIGVAFDGTGLGTDGTVWGGEFLIADCADFERVAHFAPFPLAGNERAIQEPWRVAATLLWQTFGDAFAELPLPFVRSLDPGRWALLKQALEKGLHCPLTSSAGRLFDAIAALVGVRSEVHYEGQAAIELEMSADEQCEEAYAFDLLEAEGTLRLGWSGLVEEVVADLQRGRAPGAIAARFHNALARVIAAVARRLRATYDLSTVALSGGVFQNMFLLERTVRLLEAEGFTVLTHSQVPPNDGGLALGQAAVALATA